MAQAGSKSEANKARNPDRKRKKAIILAGGGPVAGLHIGVLQYLQRQGFEFDVWALSCIGAWVGIVYNTQKGPDKAKMTFEFFHDNVFRDDFTYQTFPINRVFGADWQTNTLAAFANLSVLASPLGLAMLTPTWRQLSESFLRTLALFNNPSRLLNQGEFNEWVLNDFLAVNPFARFLSSMMYLSPTNGLSRIYYEDSSFLNNLHIETLKDNNAFVYHNAWDLTDRALKLFSNRDRTGRNYERITPATLCACSALPFIESTVELPDKHTYCEGALVDTVNFQNLLEDHFFDLDEIWISRIVGFDQVRKPKDLHDSLGNLCQLFAASVGDDDVKLFKYHLKCDKVDPLDDEGRPQGSRPWRGLVVEIPVDAHVSYRWDRGNLKTGYEHGMQEAETMFKRYGELKEELKKKDPQPGPIWLSKKGPELLRRD
ncbi:MAG: patatin-like phospholipase family protein [Hyphomicrobiales bacterium]|nr:patatin-like phospholipase family protein [Hyphomicrobiales bacterium]